MNLRFKDERYVIIVGALRTGFINHHYGTDYSTGNKERFYYYKTYCQAKNIAVKESRHVLYIKKVSVR
jgi:hypothetical protein